MAGQVPGQNPASGDAGSLKHFQTVTNSVVQDALNVWADIWAELESEDAAPSSQDTGRRTKGGAVVCPRSSDVCPLSADLFAPSCGWPEFLEKMWVLRQNLDFLARFSRRAHDEPCPPGRDSQRPA